MAWPPSIFKRHPKGFWFIFWAELAERASFYGMRVLLALYLTEVFRFSESHAAITVQVFIALCYFLPLLGGYLADRYLGKYRTIVYFAVPYILGHVILGALTTKFFLFLALLLLAMGSGAIKPNTSTLMGLMYEKEGKGELLDEAFSYFYLAINIGAALSSLSLPIVRDAYGYETAFLVPTGLMILALFIFVLGRRFYPQENKTLVPRTKTDQEKAEDRVQLYRLAPIFGLLAVFWFVYDQNASTWVFFARSNVNLVLWPFEVKLSADQLQGLNPVLIILLTPFFNWFWRTWAKKQKKELAAPYKMAIGFILVTGCMALISLAGFLSERGNVSVWFIMAATLIMTMAELCVSVIGLHFAFSEATPRMKSTLMAAFLLSQFMGDGLGAGFDRLYDVLSHGLYFGIQALILGTATVAFLYSARHFTRNRPEHPAEAHR